MALFKVNAGLREQWVCWLRWDWEVKIPSLDSSIFITLGKPVNYADGVWPGEKNKEDQIVVLNSVAYSEIESQRGVHPIYVFPFKSKRLERMHTTAWENAWKKANLSCDGSSTKGPHNLKHTFGRRLRAAGVSFETRKVLLHHTTGDITTHYSSVELQELIDAVNSICDMESGVSLTVLKRAKMG